VTPLLLSVRSGAAASMPGMMDTVLNLGLNSSTVSGIIKQTNNERFALDSYRRFIGLFSEIVLELDHTVFLNIIDSQKKTANVKFDSQLSVADLKNIIKEQKAYVLKSTKKEFPENVRE